MQFDGMVYQEIVGIPMGTNCAPLIADAMMYIDNLSLICENTNSMRKFLFK